jgi:2-iminobutanoate/2-iminopropanoate deaminase
MPIQSIRDPQLSENPLPFSSAVRVGPLIFVSGQASVDREGEIVSDTFAGEMRRSLSNMRSVLTAAGVDFSHVVQVRSYVGREEDLEEYNKVYREFFSEPFPARTTLVGCLGTALKFEIDAIAMIDPSETSQPQR